MTEKISTVYYTENNSGIVFTEFVPNLKVDLDKAKEMVANRLYLTENKKHFIIIDVSNVRDITPEAKEFLQRNDASLKNILSAAFIANNPIAALIANIFVKTPTDFETRFFTSTQEAFDWISEQKKKLATDILS